MRVFTAVLLVKLKISCVSNDAKCLWPSSFLSLISVEKVSIYGIHFNCVRARFHYHYVYAYGTLAYVLLVFLTAL